MNVLIVEDCSSYTAILKHHLMSCVGVNYNVKSVVSAQQALDLLEEFNPAIIFLDYYLPGVSGADFAKGIQDTLGEDIPIVVMTEHGNSQASISALDAGVVDYVLKEHLGPSSLEILITNAIHKKKLAKKINDKNKKINEFIAILAHDLRSPLSNIQAYAKLGTENGKKVGLDCVELLGKVGRIATDGLEIINDVLGLTRVESGSFDIHKQESSLREYLDTILVSFTEMARRKNIEIGVEFHSEERAVFDPRALRLVLGNLLTNAVKFTGSGGSITVKTETFGDKTRISIADTGVGVSPDFLQDLFSTSVKTTGLGTEGESGTGLGLPFSYELVKAHGSELKVSSQEGSGSIFYFEL